MEHGAGLPPFPRHFDGKRYFNPGAPGARGFLEVLRWKLTTHPQPSPRFIDDVEPSKPPSCPDSNALRITLVNHSTVLLQHRDSHILTDPIWSERASPLAWIGPRRHRAPGMKWEDLPRIDTVLLSHNHYDHLDLPTLRRLSERGHSEFIVPSGVARLLRSHKIGPVHELDWGESFPDTRSHQGRTVVHGVPAYHFSARGLFDRDRTLWCGYVIEMGGHMIFFAGDTAFGPHFAQIRERFGAPRVALLPIGAYDPRWFMSSVHMGPDEAVRAHGILGAKTSIAIHHGTFQLTDESINTPKKSLRACDPDGSFLTLDNGQTVILSE